jgi:hypothetical protein
MSMPLLEVVDVRLGAITLAPWGSPPLVLVSDGFIYKGQLIADAGAAYTLFYDTMTLINAREQAVEARAHREAHCWQWVVAHAHWHAEHDDGHWQIGHSLGSDADVNAFEDMVEEAVAHAQRKV